MYRLPNACFNAAKVGSPVQWPGATFSTLNTSLSAVTAFELTSSVATTRWNPPAIEWILGLMAAAASTILSIPGCEQPTTSTTPSDVLMASDNSLSSLVPGALGHERDERDSGGNFGRFVDGFEVGTLPSGPEFH